MDFDRIIEIIGFVTGLFYLWWEYRVDSKVWLASMVMPLIGLWLYYRKGLYADFTINIYYLVISVYGYWVWTRKTHLSASAEAGSRTGQDNNVQSGHTVPALQRMSASVIAGSVAVVALLWAAIWWGLVTFTDSQVAVADAFTTAMSVVGLWLLARKYVEQWLVWLVVDMVSSGLYCYKQIYFYCILYAIYSVVAVFGYLRWRRLYQTQSDRL